MSPDLSEDSSPSRQVLQALADHLNTPITALPPLYHAIDPETLDRVFSSTRNGMRTGTVRFSYLDHVIRVTIGQQVSVIIESSRDESAEPPGGPPRD